MAKTDWQMNDVVQPDDLNQLGQEVNDNADDLAAHKADYAKHTPFAVTAGSSNAFTVTLNPALTSYTDGLGIVIAVHQDATAACTLNVNGLGAVPIKKANGNDVTNLKANGVYTLRYVNGNFILQGEGGSGTAQPEDVLVGETFTNDEGEQTGTMPNNGAVSATLTSQGQQYTVPNGYHNGLGKVTANITNLTAGNVKAGVTVGGVQGTFTSDANASASNILSGKTAYVNGSKVTGTMPNRGNVTQTLTQQGQQYTIPSGYHAGGGKITASFANLIADNIREGVNIGGVVGSLKPLPAIDVKNINIYNNYSTIYATIKGGTSHSYVVITIPQTDGTIVAISQCYSSSDKAIKKWVFNASNLSLLSSTTVIANRGYYSVCELFPTTFMMQDLADNYAIRKYDYNGNLLATYYPPSNVVLLSRVISESGVFIDTYYNSVYAYNASGNLITSQSFEQTSGTKFVQWLNNDVCIAMNLGTGNDHELIVSVDGGNSLQLASDVTQGVYSYMQLLYSVFSKY